MCKHGETSCVCNLCDQETIDRLAPQSPVDMEDWVPEMGWEIEDYE